MSVFVKDDPRINRNGRPKKGEALTDILREYLDGRDEGDLHNRKTELIKRLYKMAQGDIVALKYAINRIDGMPKVKQEIEMHDDNVEGYIDALNRQQDE